MSIQIADNFTISINKDIDNRKIWESKAKLINNTDIIMPVGFLVYCKAENKYFMLKSAENEYKPSTYKWDEFGFSESVIENFTDEELKTQAKEMINNINKELIEK